MRYGKNFGHRLAVALGAAGMFSLSAIGVASPAHARSLTARIDVNTSDMSATAYVYDNVFNGRYTAVLTAVGPVVCGLAGAQTVIVDTANHTGNPATPRTDGTCTNRYNGVVTYDLNWVGVLGTSGHLTRVCTITLGIVLCSPNGTTATIPDADAS